MKRYIVLLAVLLVAVLLSGCGKKVGMLDMSIEYPDSVDVTQQRNLDFVVTITNTGEAPCNVQNIFSPDFWKPEEPGLTGNVNQEFERIVEPGSTEIFVVNSYIWDSDTLNDHLKNFAITANIEDNKECPQPYVTEQGVIWLFK